MRERDSPRGTKDADGTVDRTRVCVSADTM